MILFKRNMVRGWLAAGWCLCLGGLLTGCGMMGDNGGYSDSGTSATTAPAGTAGPTGPASASAMAQAVDAHQPCELLSVGDKVAVSLVLPGTPTPEQPQAHVENIREDGKITLDNVGSVQAAGRAPGDLQQAIYNLYVPQYYTSNLNVTVTAPERVYYVGGEVKTPNRYLYQTSLTVSKAIQSAGDFTEFANKKKVELTRKDGTTYFINCIKVLDHPELDLPVCPGDTIHVFRHW